MTTTLLFPKLPYSFAWSAKFFGFFKNDLIDIWTPTSINFTGSYCRVFETNNGLCLVKITQENDDVKQPLKIQILKGALDQNLCDVLAKMFRINLDLTDFYNLVKKEPTLSQLIKYFYGLKPIQTPTVFEMVIIAILEQQISLPVAVTLRSRLAQRFGKSIEYQGRTYYTFPSVEKLATISTDDLHALSIPIRKAKNIINIARMQLSGKFNFENLYLMSNLEVLECLLKIPGIGPWSAEYIMTRGLGRLDVYPKTDLSIRRAVSYFHNNGNILDFSQVERILSQTHPFERLAAYYFVVAYKLKNTENFIKQ